MGKNLPDTAPVGAGAPEKKLGRRIGRRDRAEKRCGQILHTVVANAGTVDDVKTFLQTQHDPDGTHPLIRGALIARTAAQLQIDFPPGTAGRLARVTDGIRGIWKDTGTAWVSVTGWADITDFGASPSASSATSAWFKPRR